MEAKRCEISIGMQQLNKRASWAGTQGSAALFNEHCFVMWMHFTPWEEDRFCPSAAPWRAELSEKKNKNLQIKCWCMCVIRQWRRSCQGCVFISCLSAPGGRLITSTCGSLRRLLLPSSSLPSARPHFVSSPPAELHLPEIHENSSFLPGSS